MKLTDPIPKCTLIGYCEDKIDGGYCIYLGECKEQIIVKERKESTKGVTK